MAEQHHAGAWVTSAESAVTGRCRGDSGEPPRAKGGLTGRCPETHGGLTGRCPETHGGLTGRCPETHGGLTSQAREERIAHFVCALTFAGMYTLNPSFFSPARLADKRLPRPASCQSPPPKAVPALGIHPASGTTSFFVLKRCSMRHNASSILDYRGQFRVRKLKSQAIRSTPRKQWFVLVISTTSRQGVHSTPPGLSCTS